MSEQNLGGEPQTVRRGVLSPANLMTTQATAIASFAFAVFSMLGQQGSWSTALTSLLWGTSYDIGAVDEVMVAWGVGGLLIAAVGVWLAHRTLRVVDQAWEAHLARAAVLIAAVGALLAVVAILGGLLH